MDPRKSILELTARKFFPQATVEVGLLPDPWAKLAIGTVMAEVHVSRNTPIDDFEEEAWHQFDKLRTAFNLNEVDATPTTSIVVDIA